MGSVNMGTNEVKPKVMRPISHAGKYLVLGLLLAGSAMNAQAEQLVRTFSGERTGTTAEFEVKAPWIMDWRTTGDYSKVAAVDVSLFNAKTGIHEGTALRTKVSGNGVRLFEQSGRFYFRVDATLMGWTLKVIQLTPEEAEQYKPVSKDPFDL